MFSFDFMYIVAGIQVIVALLLLYFLDQLNDWKNTTRTNHISFLTPLGEPEKSRSKREVNDNMDAVGRIHFYIGLTLFFLVFSILLSFLFITNPADLNIHTKG